jgi:hypothetical protein
MYRKRVGAANRRSWGLGPRPVAHSEISFLNLHAVGLRHAGCECGSVRTADEMTVLCIPNRTEVGDEPRPNTSSTTRAHTEAEHPKDHGDLAVPLNVGRVDEVS